MLAITVFLILSLLSYKTCIMLHICCIKLLHGFHTPYRQKKVIDRQ